ncbi:MAG: DUF4423 domain-containing protein [Bdellovibrio sp.]
MAIFEFNNYREYFLDRIKKMPKRGRGEFRNISLFLRMHTSSISQIFKGQKNLTLEQASSLAVYFGMNDLESDYLLNLVEKERAGSQELIDRIDKRLTKIKKAATQLSNRLPKDRILSDNDKALFYSNWFYSAVRLASDVKSLQTVEALSQHFSLPPALINDVMQFLLSTGLCVEDQGQFKMGPQRTHLEATSPLISRHHMNWRIKAIERSPKMVQAEELQFSSPVVLSQKDILRIRSQLLDHIQDILKTVSESESEDTYFFNVDWLKLR